MPLDMTEARARMITEQLEPRGISDPRVLAAMRTVARHRFLPSEYAEHAYDDGPLPIGAGQTISQPYMVGLTSQVAALSGGERVLEIGTGSGYQTAILAGLAAEVYSVECLSQLHNRARAVLAALELKNCFLVLGDGSEGLPASAPFDVIVVTAAMPGIPRPLLQQLKLGGGLVAPIGEDDLQTLVRISRRNGHWQEEYFGECRFVKMVGRHGFQSG